MENYCLKEPSVYFWSVFFVCLPFRFAFKKKHCLLYVAVFINFLSIYFPLLFFVGLFTILNLTLRWFTYLTVRLLIASLHFYLFFFLVLLLLVYCCLFAGFQPGASCLSDDDGSDDDDYCVRDTKKPLCRVNDFKTNLEQIDKEAFCVYVFLLICY